MRVVIQKLGKVKKFQSFGVSGICLVERKLGGGAQCAPPSGIGLKCFCMFMIGLINT